MHVPKVQQQLSWVPLKLKTSVNSIELTVATGFVYQHDARSFLITNYHVVSGRHPETGAALHSSCAFPDSLTVGVPVDVAPKVVQWKWWTFPLCTQGEQATAIWTEHPQHGSKVDAVAIPVSGLEGTRVIAANADRLDLFKIRLYPSLEAFVLGYPFGMSGGGHLPIWKRATIATEPDFDMDGLPRFYIDTATRKGMSGSPVYAQEVGYLLPEGETDETRAFVGKAGRFVGVYSGRIGAEGKLDDFKVQLGFVWKESALISLVEAVPADTEPLPFEFR